MSLFRCDNCGTIDNTATGWYWSRNRPSLTKKEYLGKALCACCAPQKFPDGTETPFNGKWHDKFPKEQFDETCYTLLENSIVTEIESITNS